MAKNRPKLSILRSREGGARRALRQAGELWRGSLGLRALWAVLFLVLGTWSLMPGGFFFAPRARAGAIAGQDYVAPHDLLLPDEESTRAKQARARDGVLPVYDFDPGLQTERDQQLESLFSRGRQLAGKPEANRSREAEETLKAELTGPGDGPGPSGLKLTPEEIGPLLRKRFSADLEDRLRGVVAQVLRRGIVANKSLLLENRLRGIVVRNLATRSEKVQFDLFNHLGYPDELRDTLEAEVRSGSGLSAADRKVLVDLLFDNLQPNLHLNRSETLARREAAAAAAGTVFTQVRKGQVIVRKGDQINATAARVISQMRGDRRLGHQLPPVLGTLLLLSMAALVLWLGLQNEKVADHSRERAFGETLLVLLVSLLGAKFFLLVAGALAASFSEPPFNSFQSWVYAVPFATLALLAALLLTRNTALVLAFLFPLLISRAVEGGDSQGMVLYGTAGSLAAIFALDRYQLKQRLVMMRIGSVVGVVNAIMAMVIAGLAGNLDRGAMDLGFDLLTSFASGFLVAGVAGFAVPVLESLLSITTDIKLIELANTNLPLLRRLAFEAPGTFQHSLMVANLAKEGCEAIGADSALAYTGGLYHDVGKIFRPDYFIENQRPGQNRHDKLLPSMSALILINHVKEGLELAREHNLPQPIRDAVEQHHGTRLIKYFYNRALELAEPSTGEVREEKYRYPGPKPQNRVMGVLMLADGIEAASRTLVEPTPSKIRTLIRTITEDCLRDGQLDETDLTLHDLSRISEAFFRVLANIFHQRIDYPGFDFNSAERGERSPTRERRVPTGSIPAAAAAGAGGTRSEATPAPPATGPVKVS